MEIIQIHGRQASDIMFKHFHTGGCNPGGCSLEAAIFCLGSPGHTTYHQYREIQPLNCVCMYMRAHFNPINKQKRTVIIFTILLSFAQTTANHNSLHYNRRS
jgi:hypothetical protein